MPVVIFELTAFSVQSNQNFLSSFHFPLKLIHNCHLCLRNNYTFCLISEKIIGLTDCWCKSSQDIFTLDSLFFWYYHTWLVWESKGLTEPPHHSNAGIVWPLSEQCQLVTQRMRTISRHYLSQSGISFLIIIVYFVSSRFSFGMLGYPTELKIKINCATVTCIGKKLCKHITKL